MQTFTPRRRFSLGKDTTDAARAASGRAPSPLSMMMGGAGTPPPHPSKLGVRSVRSDPAFDRNCHDDNELDDLDGIDNDFQSSSVPNRPPIAKPLPPSSPAPPPLPPRPNPSSALSSALQDFLDSIDAGCSDGFFPLPTSPNLLHKLCRTSAAPFKLLMKEFRKHGEIGRGAKNG